MVLYILRELNLIFIPCSLLLCCTGFYNSTISSGEVTYTATTEWPWPWHPDIHWYNEYLNLSSVGPEIWNGLHLGLSVGLPKYNHSHVAYKWVAQVYPNFTAADLVYKEQYEGTGRNMFACWPTLLGKYPDWFTDWDEIWSCGNYVPQGTYIRLQKEWDHLYNTKKPFVDICIAIGTVVMVVGIPGKLLSPHFTQDIRGFPKLCNLIGDS